MNPYLDPMTNKVHCSDCHQEILNITQFTKSQMKSNKQFKAKQQKSFSVKCPKCQQEDRPILTPTDIVCSFCQQPLSHLSEPFKMMLREKISSADKDI
jgi:hypothetical protein